MRHIFISPHLDDTILSCTDYILELKNQGQKITIITVFTDFGTDQLLSRSSSRFMAASSCLTTTQFQSLRIQEDLTATALLGAKAVHLSGFTDAGFRTHAQFTSPWQYLQAIFGVGSYFLYPTHTDRHLFSGNIHPHDLQLSSKIYQALTSHIKNTDILYFPIGVGNHADHLIVNKIARQFPNLKRFWLDYPYALLSQHKQSLPQKLKKYHLFKKPAINQAKLSIINTYASQESCKLTAQDLPHFQDKLYTLLDD